MIHIHGISKQYGSKTLFENAEAHIGHRSRVALVGPNGAGKSTLIRILLGHESPDSGSVSRASHLAIGYLAQEVPQSREGSILSEVLRMDGRREGLVQLKQELEENFVNNPEDEAALERYGRIVEELDLMDESRIEARAKEILLGMGFKVTDFDRRLAELSGGWLMRVALSRILLMDPDLLLLDEPTNHLDLESLLWLEEFLKAFRGAMLLVSHDTAFLNRMVTEVLEIDQKKLWIYRGNLNAYAEQKSQRLEVLKSQYAGQQAKIAEIESFVERFGAKATKARQAQSRLKQLEKMDLIELPEDRSNVRFRFPQAPHSGKEVITMKGATVRFGQKTVFKDLDWVVRRGSRVAIVGVNGAGKTTLLKLLSGQFEPSEGEARLGHEVKVGYYAQMQSESLNMSKTILEELEMTAREMPVSQVRAIAGAFLFTGESVQKKCGVLSGGEKARVALAKLLLSPSNFLILDEPTNHLDVESRGVLLDALRDYSGTLCLVSHDRSFVSPLVDSVLEIQPQQGSEQGSRVIQLLGGYEDYLEKKQREVALSVGSKKSNDRPSLRGASEQQPSRGAEPVRTGRTDRSGGSSRNDGNDDPFLPLSDASRQPSHNQKRNWERERQRLEGAIAQHEKRQAELHLELADPNTYQDKNHSFRLIEEQRSVAKNLSEKLARWEELCLLLE